MSGFPLYVSVFSIIYPQFHQNISLTVKKIWLFDQNHNFHMHFLVDSQNIPGKVLQLKCNESIIPDQVHPPADEPLCPWLSAGLGLHGPQACVQDLSLPIS